VGIAKEARSVYKIGEVLKIVFEDDDRFQPGQFIMARVTSIVGWPGQINYKLDMPDFELVDWDEDFVEFEQGRFYLAVIQLSGKHLFVVDDRYEDQCDVSVETPDREQVERPIYDRDFNVIGQITENSVELIEPLVEPKE
jgi:hypothetical protein